MAKTPRSFEPPEPRLDINQSAYATQLSRALALQQRVPQVLDRRIQAGVQVDDFTLPEFFWLRQGVLACQWVQTAAVAAENSFAEFTPAAGVITVLEGMWLMQGNAAASTIKFGYAIGNAVGAITSGSARDDRAPGVPGGTIQYGTTPAIIHPVMGQVRLTATPGDKVYVPLNFVMTNPAKGPAAPPFQKFKISSAAVNQVLDVTLFWRERPIMESER